MKQSEIISGLDEFLDKAMSLQPGGEIVYSTRIDLIPGRVSHVVVRYQRAIGIYYLRYGDPFYDYREVLWSPMKLRRYLLKQMGMSYHRCFMPDWAQWRQRRIIEWWAREWGRGSF